MAIPVASSEVLAFTPESLKEKLGDEAPKFRLRTVNERHLRRFRQEVSDDGLISYSDDEFTAEKMRAINELWSAEDAQGLKDRFNTLVESLKQGVEIPAEDFTWLEELDDALFDNWKPLRVMRRKSGEWREYALRIMVSTYVIGWENLDAKHALEAGYLSRESVASVEKALRRLGEQHLGAEARHVPFLELCAAASRQLGLVEDEEKNSPAPSQPGSTPDASTANPPMDGASIAADAEDSSSSSTSPQTTPPESE